MKTFILITILACCAALALWLLGCYYEPRVLTHGHIRGRHCEGSLYVVEVIGIHGDTVDCRTSEEVYRNYPDIYFTAIEGRDSLLRVRWYDQAADPQRW